MRREAKALIKSLTKPKVKFEHLTDPRTSEILETTSVSEFTKALISFLPSNGASFDLGNIFFKNRLRKRWKIPLSLFQLHITLCQNSGIAALGELRANKEHKCPLKLEVLASLHARALLVSRECLSLLENGFSEGALARWRTIHEMNVIACFIRINNEEIAHRYMLSSITKAYKAGMQFNEYKDRAKIQQLTSNEMKFLSDAYKAILNEHGENMKEDFGWASPAIITKSNRPKEKPTLFDLEEATELDHWRPRFRWSSSKNHGGFSLPHQTLGSENNKILIGPSNYGLIEPMHMVAISLQTITGQILLERATPASISVLETIIENGDRIGAAALDVQRTFG